MVKHSIKVFALLLFLIAVAQPSFGQAGINDVREDDKEARNFAQGFGARLILVERPKEFVDLWEKPETPRIETIAAIKTKQPFGAFVLFTGCRPGKSGSCDCEVDFNVYRPDGTLYAKREGLELWKQPAPPSQHIQMSVASLFLRMGVRDPAGRYIVKATVRDKNAEVEFEIRTSFRLETP